MRNRSCVGDLSLVASYSLAGGMRRSSYGGGEALVSVKVSPN